MIYLATILAEFEGLKDNYLSPRILLIEELEAHLHPQIQIKVLKYLREQTEKNDIQVIITTHSTTIASATPIENIICFNVMDSDIKITSLDRCIKDEKAINFINRWLDTTRSTLLFSKGNILVEGLAEALLLPKLAEIYLQDLKQKNKHIPTSLEEAGISVINMNGIFFQYFLKLYDGYELVFPKQEKGETKEAYKERMNLFKKKQSYNENEFIKTDYIPIRCVALTDNDPKENITVDNEEVDGNNPQLFLIQQIENMTNNCKVFKNRKTFEYDLALEKDNAVIMIEIILDELETNGDIRKRLKGYLNAYKEKESVNQFEVASDILKQIDSSITVSN